MTSMGRRCHYKYEDLENEDAIMSFVKKVLPIAVGAKACQ
jgi:hypothetical protein